MTVQLDQNIYLNYNSKKYTVVLNGNLANLAFYELYEGNFTVSVFITEIIMELHPSCWHCLITMHM